jgi:hypothetical protein
MDTTEDKSSSPNEKTLPYESTAQGYETPWVSHTPPVPAAMPLPQPPLPPRAQY